MRARKVTRRTFGACFVVYGVVAVLVLVLGAERPPVVALVGMGLSYVCTGLLLWGPSRITGRRKRNGGGA